MFAHKSTLEVERIWWDGVETKGQDDVFQGERRMKELCRLEQLIQVGNVQVLF